jgi:hypothetical protein
MPEDPIIWSADAGSTWHASATTLPTTGFISSIAIDAHDNDTIYFTVSTANSGLSHVNKIPHLFTGTNPSPVSLDGTYPYNITDFPVHSVVSDTTNSNRLWVGTDLGVYTSTDNGNNWMAEVTGFGSTDVEWLVQNKPAASGIAKLYAFSHGRGAYRVSTGIVGDASTNGVVDVNDVFFMINYLFAGGPPPLSLGLANVNGDSVVDVADVFYLINYLFAGGPPAVGGSGAGPQAPAALQTIADGVKVGTVTAHPSGTVRVPVYVKDVSGSSIGRDRPLGRRISQIGFGVTPGNSCASPGPFDFSTGVLNGMGSHVSSSGSYLIFSASEAGHGTIPLVLDAWAQIGSMVYTLTSCPLGTINLTPIRTGTTHAILGCDQCTVDMIETTENGGLTATSGSRVFRHSSGVITVAGRSGR